MKRAIVAFMVVAGMALVMAGCGGTDEGAAKKAPGAPAGTAKMPVAPEKETK